MNGGDTGQALAVGWTLPRARERHEAEWHATIQPILDTATAVTDSSREEALDTAISCWSASWLGVWIGSGPDSRFAGCVHLSLPLPRIGRTIFVGLGVLLQESATDEPN